jgi:hypothetical protein
MKSNKKYAAEQGLAIVIIYEQFGPLCKIVVKELFINSQASIGQLITNMKIPFHIIKKALRMLVLNNCVKYNNFSDKSNIEKDFYCAIVQNILFILRFPRFLVYIRDIFGDLAEQLITTLTISGILRLEHCIQVTVITSLKKSFTYEFAVDKKKACNKIMTRLINEKNR